MKNKRGFLLGEETLKIIVAVICIILLVGLLVALYYSQINSAKTKQAQATLTNSSESIASVIERVELGQGLNGSSETKLIHNPSGWYLSSYTGNSQKPNSCAGENCLCICDKVFVDTLFGIMDSRQLKECDKNGACLIVSDLKDKEISIKINPGTGLLIKKQDNFIEVSEYES
jgi:hypothetical protein